MFSVTDGEGVLVCGERRGGTEDEIDKLDIYQISNTYPAQWKGWPLFWTCWVETKIFSKGLTGTDVGMYVSFLLYHVFMTDWSAPLLCWLFDGLRSRLGVSLDHRASLMAQMVKNPPVVQETRVWSLVWEDPLKKGMATHSSILAWRIPLIEELGRLQSMGLQRVRNDWATNIHTHKASLFFLLQTFRSSASSHSGFSHVKGFEVATLHPLIYCHLEVFL